MEIDPNDPSKVVIDKEMFEKLSALPEIVSGLVEEVKTERKSKQDAEAQRDAAIAAANTPPADAGTEDAATVVSRIFAERDQDSLKAARVSAEEAFKNTHKEFHPDNDPAGLKYAAFERSLAKVNLAGAKSEKEYSELFEDAFILMNKGVVTPQGGDVPYEGDPSDSGGAPISRTATGLTPIEIRLIKSLPGWTEEKYLAIKKSRPAYVENLLKYAK